MKFDYPYIAQWLPVDGEIAQNDWYMVFAHGMFSRRKNHWFGRRWDLHQAGKVPKLAAKLHNLLYGPDKIKVKLFLCARELNPGDEYMFLTYDQDYVQTRRYNGGPISEHWFKKLHKISPEAGWVKGGEEFTEDEIQPWNSLLNVAIEKKYLVDPEPGLIASIKILCNHCKHFQ